VIDDDGDFLELGVFQTLVP